MIHKQTIFKFPWGHVEQNKNQVLKLIINKFLKLILHMKCENIILIKGVSLDEF